MNPRIALASIATVLALAAGGTRAAIPQVQHVIVVIQENRSPDNLFHGLNSQLPAADIANAGLNSKGQSIPLTQIPLAGTYDIDHSHLAFNQMWQNGKMDGADLEKCIPLPKQNCPANPQFVFVNPADVAPYFWIATHYGFANRMFQSNQGPSFAAHQFLFGGTSQVTALDLFFAANDTLPVSGGSNGCDAPSNKSVALVGPKQATRKAFPCFEHSTLSDLIDAAPPLSWRYYAPNEGSIWTAPNAIKHICRAAGMPKVCSGPSFTNGEVVIDPPQILKDISGGKLASVSWVNPYGFESDHPTGNDGSGPAWVASIVNAVGQSAYWPNTVILILWDDWGGWYDHVPPPIDAKYPWYENGFRVPLLVVSAYTPPGYVSTATHTFGSVLKFIETAFGLPLIPPGFFADARADDLSDFFNFNAQAAPFTPVPGARMPEFFDQRKHRQSDPDTE